MRATVIRLSLGTMLIVGAACETQVPTSPRVVNPPFTGPVVATPKFPAPTGPSRTFVFDHELSFPVSGGTASSRFVLYDNGAFELQYSASLQYRGRYTETDGKIVFEWEGWSVAGPWGATGTLRGDMLAVEYNMVMTMSDFDDGVYRKS